MSIFDVFDASYLCLLSFFVFFASTFDGFDLKLPLFSKINSIPDIEIIGKPNIKKQSEGASHSKTEAYLIVTSFRQNRGKDAMYLRCLEKDREMSHLILLSFHQREPSLQEILQRKQTLLHSRMWHIQVKVIVNLNFECWAVTFRG